MRGKTVTVPTPAFTRVETMSPSTPTRTRTRLSPEQRRESILEAAREVAVSEGLLGLTLKSVGAKAGVASSLVAHYFPVMNELVVETFRALAGDELDSLRVLQLREPSALGRMRILVDWLQGAERLDVTATWLDATLLGRRNETLAAEVRQQLDRWQESVSGLIREGVAAGEFTCDRPEIVAAHILSLIDGLNTNSLVNYHDAAGLAEYLRELVEAELHLPRGSLTTAPPHISL